MPRRDVDVKLNFIYGVFVVRLPFDCIGYFDVQLEMLATTGVVGFSINWKLPKTKI